MWISHAALAQCTVENQQELLDRLACIASGTCHDCETCTSEPHGCPEIIINTNMTIDAQIDIGAAHEGLTLTINATLTSTGGGALGSKLFSVSGTSNITIRGSGHITSTQTPPSQSVAAVWVVGVDGITVEGLSFSKLNWAVNVEGDGVTSKNITLTDLTGDHFVKYGVWIGVQNAPMVENTTITNCHFSRPIIEYPFRIYSHNTTVLNCSGMDSGSSSGGKAGIWIVEGDNILIDGFTTNRHIRIGPNPVFEDGGERLRCARIFNVTMANIPSSDPPKHLILYPGVLGSRRRTSHQAVSAGLYCG